MCSWESNLSQLMALPEIHQENIQSNVWSGLAKAWTSTQLRCCSLVLNDTSPLKTLQHGWSTHRCPLYDCKVPRVCSLTVSLHRYAVWFPPDMLLNITIKCLYFGLIWLKVVIPGVVFYSDAAINHAILLVLERHDFPNSHTCSVFV